MNNYFDDWADKYLETAGNIKEQIKQCRAERSICKDKTEILSCDQKIMRLYEMYNDTMYSADTLRRRANCLRRKEGDNSK